MHMQTTEARLIRRAERAARKRHKMTAEERRLAKLIAEMYGDDRKSGPYRPRHRKGRA